MFKNKDNEWGYECLDFNSRWYVDYRNWQYGGLGWRNLGKQVNQGSMDDEEEGMGFSPTAED